MFRKIVLLSSILVFLMTSAVTFAAGTPNPDADENGCFIDSTVTAVNEGVSIPVVIKCVGIPTDNNVFGFQFGTLAPTGDFSGAAPTAYTFGEFTSLATGGTDGVVVGANNLALYGVSRKTTNVVTATDFTLGGYTLTAVTSLTDADGSVEVVFVDETFKLSDNLGAHLPNWLRTVNDYTTTVNDIDLAWLSGNITIQSDSNVLTEIKSVSLNLGEYAYSAASEASYTTDLVISSGNLYVEDADGVVGGSFAVAEDSDDVLNIAVSANMWGHLACSSPVVNLGDTGGVRPAADVIGDEGVITLLAGDVNSDGAISNTDATVIGDDFGDSDLDINQTVGIENDINLDGTVDIFDLVHIGRNFGAATGTCS